MSEAKELKVATAVEGVKRTASFSHDMPSSLEEAISLLGNGDEEKGKERVFSRFKYGYTMLVQDAARTHLASVPAVEGQTDYSPAVQEHMQSWHISNVQPRGTRKTADPMQKIIDMYGSLTPEQQKEIASRFGLPVALEPQEEPRRARR